ncbi:MAG: hypothetical protein U5K00_14495 [Melioribacteraceae bacterium]|nr:hypothetical protein [Melioribacteraceae bacterium]
MKNRTELREKIINGVRLAVERLIQTKANENDYIVISRNGKILRIPATEFVKKS